MSRPANPSYVVPVWAPNTAYPVTADPWSSTPTKVTHPGAATVGYTPKTGVSAQSINLLVNSAFVTDQSAKTAIQSLLDMSGQLPALNWSTANAMPITPVAVAFSDNDGSWIAFQASSTLCYRSFDFGRSWTAATALPSTSATGNDVAYDTSGNVCIASLLNIYDSPAPATFGGALTWTTRSTALGVQGAVSNLVYEPVAGRWVAIGGGGSITPWVYTSTNRSTWTVSTTPWIAAASEGLALGAGGGVLVASYCGATSSFRTMRSADGGQSWSSDQAITQNAGIVMTAGVPTTRPVWSAPDGLWYIACSQASPRKTQVFSSPDGITWTSAATLLANDCRFLSLQAIGSLIVAINDDGRIFCSPGTKGQTWFRCGALSSTPSSAPLIAGTGAKSGGGGMLIASAANCFVSSRYGLPLVAA